MGLNPITGQILNFGKSDTASFYQLFDSPK